MKNRNVLIIAFILCIIAGFSIYNHYEKQIVMSLNNKKIVVVDVGHGGSDPGKVSTDGIKEKDVNLQIATYLKDYLIAMDYTVYMTRETDCGLYDENVSNKKKSDLNNRIKFFSEKNADYVISIHQNSYPDPSQHGAQTFYYSKNEEGKALALSIQESLLAMDRTNKRSAKGSDSYYILKKTTTPAVIIECGFLSNREESANLINPDYQKRLAYSIAKGLP